MDLGRSKRSRRVTADLWSSGQRRGFHTPASPVVLGPMAKHWLDPWDICEQMKGARFASLLL